MKKHDHPASAREPWLADLNADLANASEEGGEATSADFIRRVMNATPAPQAEPWLECLALDAAAEPNPAFAAQVAAIFTAERARRRTLRRKVFVAAELAACVALCAVLFWPSATLRPVAVIHQEASPNAFAADLQHTATDWLADQTQQVDTSVDAVQSSTTALLAKCALPIKASSVLLGLDIPPELQKEMDARKADDKADGKADEARPGI